VLPASHPGVVISEAFVFSNFYHALRLISSAKTRGLRRGQTWFSVAILIGVISYGPN